MTTVISGSYPAVNSDSDATINGLTVGRGSGAVSSNTATGNLALRDNTTGTNNSGFGQYALVQSTTGVNNTAIGGSALYSNTTGSQNTALGTTALYLNTTASNNTAVGYQAGYSNTTGAENTAVGRTALQNATTGSGNTVIGEGSGNAITTGGKNTIVGRYSGNGGGLDIRTASNHIVLSDGDGNPRAYWNASGHVFFPAVRGSAGTYAARFTGSLELTVDTSSARYKDNIRNSIYGLDDLLKIQSRQFEYKDDGRSDVGFIAEEMVDVIPEVVAIDKEGRPDAISYDRLVSVCVKAIQELNAKVEAQALEIATLKGN